MRIAAWILLAALPLPAQTQPQHSVTLTWIDTANPSGTTYDVYRATGACPAMPPSLTSLGGFAVLNLTAITAKAYSDVTVVSASTYCYFVTAVLGVAQSAPSNTVPAIIPSLYAPFVQVTVSQ